VLLLRRFMNEQRLCENKAEKKGDGRKPKHALDNLAKF